MHGSHPLTTIARCAATLHTVFLGVRLASAFTVHRWSSSSPRPLRSLRILSEDDGVNLRFLPSTRLPFPPCRLQMGEDDTEFGRVEREREPWDEAWSPHIESLLSSSYSDSPHSFLPRRQTDLSEEESEEITPEELSRSWKEAEDPEPLVVDYRVTKAKYGIERLHARYDRHRTPDAGQLLTPRSDWHEEGRRLNPLASGLSRWNERATKMENQRKSEKIRKAVEEDPFSFCLFDLDELDFENAERQEAILAFVESTRGGMEGEGSESTDLAVPLNVREFLRVCSGRPVVDPLDPESGDAQRSQRREECASFLREAELKHGRIAVVAGAAALLAVCAEGSTRFVESIRELTPEAALKSVVEFGVFPAVLEFVLSSTEWGGKIREEVQRIVKKELEAHAATISQASSLLVGLKTSEVKHCRMALASFVGSVAWLSASLRTLPASSAVLLLASNSDGSQSASSLVDSLQQHAEGGAVMAAGTVEALATVQNLLA
uniref:Uncharacterized protein n=1 Tax=Chromera velia CCMP2878 TaxID=1169474 RepID=A0A0G4HTS7_9ALVE|eukprot:Cvel_8485.t1-p1 / transcript=Cvel_8485.t1 / gene=Cvel_8485 / organism=Chromera_velia_CCMP2878 / gene_product=hypothetical protein / transcript_product=hypothetical protein / location=Cvel_scaffold469:10376-13155(-) / protein_length=491 / sequence_SO=supercontig / SO=protein_coding / is_pseudo=false